MGKALDFGASEGRLVRTIVYNFLEVCCDWLHDEE